MKMKVKQFTSSLNNLTLIKLKFVREYVADTVMPFVSPSSKLLQNKVNCCIRVYTDLVPSVANL